MTIAILAIDPATQCGFAHSSGFRFAALVVGAKFGNITITKGPSVIRRNGGSATHVEAICDCGRSFSPRASHVLGGKTKSCGCVRDAKFAAQVRETRLPEGEAAMRNLYAVYKGGARRRGLAFDLPREHFRTLTQLPCCYCGTPPASVTSDVRMRTHRQNGRYRFNGIDRQDNAVGYTVENSVPCCHTCNSIKSSRSVMDMLLWARRFVNHNYEAVLSNKGDAMVRMPTSILALDVATRCGWAHRSDSAGMTSGTFDLTARRDESKSMRLIRFHGKLNELHASLSLDLVVFEAARHANPKMLGAIVVQAELQGVLKLWCEHNKIDYRGYSPSELKKHATGKGNANKDAMIAAAKAKFGAIRDDNEADALWLLDLARRDVGERAAVSISEAAL